MARTKTKLFVAIVIVFVAVAGSFSFYYITNAYTKADVRRVACVGDSQTEITNYPNILQTRLGANFSVGNFGVSGATVVENSVNPYLQTEAYQKAQNYQPTAVVIMLGTNDARPDAYNSIDNFKHNYLQLISGFQKLSSHPQIFLMIPPPFYENNLNLSITNFEGGIIPQIQQVANETGLTLIDAYTPLLGHREYCKADGVHLNEAGSLAVADIVYRNLT